ncbi:hypothetical protein CBM2588_A40064 [Cupriavidus taiwanensis]|nr:hypothetical protein CBM2588_A40064 [Cupriavidus taiwanensis]
MRQYGNIDMLIVIVLAWLFVQKFAPGCEAPVTIYNETTFI